MYARHPAPSVGALACLLLLLTPAAAAAEWFIAPFLGIKFAGATSIVDPEEGASNTRMTLGVSGLILSDRWLGVEGEFGYSPRFFEQSNTTNLVARSNVTTLMGNVLVAVPKAITRDALRPYGTVGVGLIHVGSKDLLNVFPVDSNLFGLAVGGGAIGRLTNRTSVRFDLRYIRNISTGGEGLPTFGETRISYWRLTAGVAFSGRLF